MEPMWSVPLTSVLCAVLLLAPPARAESTNPLNDLVDAAAQRLQVAEDIAGAKWLAGAPVEDPARVQLQLTALAAAARAQHLDPEYVTQVFTDQIDATQVLEHHWFAQWKRTPASAPTSAPDLVSSRTRIDGLNQVMLAEIGRQWRQLNALDCAARRDEATRDVGATRLFDEVYQQALTAVTRDYCLR